MAKLENKSKNQRKAKKRQRETQQPSESDDEVAAKSLIVEGADTVVSQQQQQQQQEPDVEQAHTSKEAKRNKRKLPLENATKTKRSRTADVAADSNTEEAAAEDTDLPTMTQLAEAEKPENLNAVVTVRQKKKQKHQQRVEEQKDSSFDKEMKRNAEYLCKWKHARGEWKFEKLRQIGIQQTMFDQIKLNSEMWPIALEYLSGSKGAAKQTITKLAVDMIDQLDKEAGAVEDEPARQKIVESTRYQRARELLQHFD